VALLPKADLIEDETVEVGFEDVDFEVGEEDEDEDDGSSAVTTPLTMK
jgi:hypothetical protein